MAKNKVQFQKGLSLQNFFKQFGTEEQCRTALVQWRWPQGFVCPKCGHQKYCQLRNRKLFQCSKCRHQSSLTSGSIFDNTKLPLNVWFLAIYFVTQSKKSISALSLMRTVGVSYNSAHLMKHKIQQVMKERDDSQPLSSFIQVDDAYWGGKKRDGIRGRGATGKIPFIAAVCSNAEGHPLRIRFSQIQSFSKESIKLWATKHVISSFTVTSDGLRCFLAFGDAGIHHKAILTGGGPESVKIPEFKWVNTILGNVKRFFHGIYHSLSERHFSKYLAEFCYRFNRRFNIAEMIPRFMYVAVRTPPRTQRFLRLAETHG